MTDEARKTAAVLGHNFPSSEWYIDSYQIMENKIVRPEETPTASTAKQATTVTQSLVKGSIEKRLNELKKLLEQELLTKDEAAAKRKKILQGL